MYPATTLVWQRRGRGCRGRRRGGGQKNGISVCCGELLGQSAVDNTGKELLRAMLECFLLLLGVFDRAGVSLGKGRGVRSSRCNGVRCVEQYGESHHAWGEVRRMEVGGVRSRLNQINEYYRAVLSCSEQGWGDRERSGHASVNLGWETPGDASACSRLGRRDTHAQETPSTGDPDLTRAAGG
ncbi:hypothetical protein DFH08DRAFT_885917 [Mycena albidolilacea]|uniref:Uncharacterized protein n=1 Tax=Mycena albidolilacea TaxID=1033008 RepID=A0AAD6ZKN8_9AGAR|nr:hypothetical protein DFH08DRAFT_885917 [Mycena albidolilacea]